MLFIQIIILDRIRSPQLCNNFHFNFQTSEWILYHFHENGQKMATLCPHLMPKMTFNWFFLQFNYAQLGFIQFQTSYIYSQLFSPLLLTQLVTQIVRKYHRYRTVHLAKGQGHNQKMQTPLSHTTSFYNPTFIKNY